jgi:hypothetical protein
MMNVDIGAENHMSLDEIASPPASTEYFAQKIDYYIHQSPSNLLENCDFECDALTMLYTCRKYKREGRRLN